MEDALLITETALEKDPNNEQFEYLRGEILKYRQNEATLGQVQVELDQLVTDFQQEPANLTSAFKLASAYAQLQQSNAAIAVLDQLIQQSNITADAVVQTAMFAQQLRNVPLMERALLRLTEVNPNSPEAWYDLSAMQAALGKQEEAMQNIRRSVLLSDRRLQTNPSAKNLRQELANEPRFAPLRNRPDWDASLLLQ
jgi:thioredoxin-like negative regulator of GroEL